MTFLLLAVAKTGPIAWADTRLASSSGSAVGQDQPLLPSIQAFAAPGQVQLLGSGRIDATGALDRALSAGPVALPCGVYRLDRPPAPIRQSGGHALRGASSGCVTLELAYPSGDGLVFEGTSWALLEGMTISTTLPHGAGAAIQVKGSYATTIRDVVLTGSFQDMLVVDGANTTRLVDSDMHGRASHACITIDGHAVDTFVAQTNLNGCGSGVLITDASGVQLDNMDIVSSIGAGVSVQPVQGKNVNALFANQVWSDTSGTDGWSFAGSGPITEIYLSNVWASSSIKGSGMVLANPRLDGFSVVNLHAHHNHSHGLDIQAGTHVTIGTGSHFVMNGCGTPGRPCPLSRQAYNGINVAANVSDLTIIGVFSGDGGYMEKDAAFLNGQSYGLFIAPSNAGRILVADNNFHGNAVGGALIGASGRDVAVHDNVDFSTSAAGFGTIKAGVTSVIIKHGLSAAPRSVQLTPATNWNGVHVWVKNITTSTFEICSDKSSSEGVSFYWRTEAFGS